MAFDKFSKSYHDLIFNTHEAANDIIHGVPDAILMGEYHISKDNRLEQARMIRRHMPEYVLMEGFNGLNPEQTQNIVGMYKNVTLEEISKSLGISLKDIGIDADSFARLGQIAADNYKESFETLKKDINNPRNITKFLTRGVIPKNQSQLASTPLYELNTSYQMALLDILTLKSKEYMSKENFESYNKKSLADIQISSLISRADYSEGQDDVFREIAKSGSKLAGCDIRKKMPKLGNDVSIEAYNEYMERMGNYIDEKREEREREQGRRVVIYANKRKTKKPVIAIVGRSHLSDDSYIFPELEDAGLKYRKVLQKAPKRDPAREMYHSIRVGV